MRTINNQFKIIFVLIRLCNRFKLHLETYTQERETRKFCRMAVIGEKQFRQVKEKGNG
jgi:hypothetical protein